MFKNRRFRAKGVDVTVLVRPMAVDDVESAMAVVDASQASREPDRPRTPPTAAEWESARLGHLRFVERDGPGAWVAQSEDRLVGVAEAIRRDDFWGLSMLFVRPEFQSQGVGRMLLDAALVYASDTRVRMIQSSPDPRALRRYSLAGLPMHPTAKLGGEPDRRSIPHRLVGRSGSQEDLELISAVEQSLGRSRTEDVAFALRDPLNNLEVIDDGPRRGWMLWNARHLVMLGATDNQTAVHLLWRYLAGVEGEVSVHGLTSAQNWAFETAHAAHLALRIEGAMFIDGMAVPEPWVPSGWHF
jgi:GNAT superfamily N-acetyltransferase